MIKKIVCYFLFLIAYCLFYACSPNNVSIDNSLEQYFNEQKVIGCFGLYDNAQNQFTIYNLSRYRDSVYLPASTFKIVNSLIGLETGRIVDEKMIIPWDGIKRSVPEWNKDLTMAEAFRVSAVPYYQEIARRIGKDTMQFWLDSLHYASKYGKAVIKTYIDSFWLDNSIKITSDEELGLVKKLYFDQLPFQKRTQAIVKQVMLREKNANYWLSYKTGWGFRENGNSIGWIVGWIEENRHPYFFVLNIESTNHNIDMVKTRETILNNILTHLGFLQGKK